MKWWKRLFKKRKHLEDSIDKGWEEIGPIREGLDFGRKEDRERYVKEALEQMAESQKDLLALKEEYIHVTDCLKDMEEIEALPKFQSAELKEAAGSILRLEQERAAMENSKRFPDEMLYKKIESQEAEIEAGISKIKEAEQYRKLVQQDLGRLDGERHAYQYRKGELAAMKANLKGIATICLTALGVCLVMLMALQFGLGLETVAGYFISIAAAAITLTILYVKYTDAQKETERVERADNRLILLQNKVKIRYVNNVNLLDYLYMKHGVENGNRLEKLWKLYQEEKEERKKYKELQEKLEERREQLIRILLHCRVKDPERWMHQASAIVEPKEMKEIRKELVLQRQTLREQMNYNQGIAHKAAAEIKELAKHYPKYTKEISEMVEWYEKQY